MKDRLNFQEHKLQNCWGIVLSFLPGWGWQSWGRPPSQGNLLGRELFLHVFILSCLSLKIRLMPKWYIWEWHIRLLFITIILYEKSILFPVYKIYLFLASSVSPGLRFQNLVTNPCWDKSWIYVLWSYVPKAKRPKLLERSLKGKKESNILRASVHGFIYIIVFNYLNSLFS